MTSGTELFFLSLDYFFKNQNIRPTRPLQNQFLALIFCLHFRPDYLKLGQLKKLTGNASWVALTATASDNVSFFYAPRYLDLCSCIEYSFISLIYIWKQNLILVQY